MKLYFYVNESFTESFRSCPSVAQKVWQRGRGRYDALARAYFAHYGNSAVNARLVMTFDELEEALVWNELGV